jgi:hypothetical protein
MYEAFKQDLKNAKNNLSTKERWFFKYLDGKGWVSPTQAGNAYGESLHKYYHSSTASPIFKKLVILKLVERNEKGHYRMVKNV